MNQAQKQRRLEREIQRWIRDHPIEAIVIGSAGIQLGEIVRRVAASHGVTIDLHAR